MKVVYGLGRFKLRRSSCVSIGVFDGLHRGHKHIIKKLVALAMRDNYISVVITFFPHPDSVISPLNKTPLLISLKHRFALLENMGVDLCVVLKFDSHLKNIKAQDFICDILLRKFAMKALVVSSDFVFGKNREADIDTIKKISQQYNFKVYSEKPLKDADKIISSTLIRSLIVKGHLARAARLLGRRVEVIGTVTGGDRRGRKLGFATANIDPHHEVIPPVGVYLIKTWLGKKEFFGLANIGFRPTFVKPGKNTKEIIEVHLFNFRGNIYSKEVKVIFMKKIRNEKKFNKKEDLIEQVKKDIYFAKSFFSRNLL